MCCQGVWSFAVYIMDSSDRDVMSSELISSFIYIGEIFFSLDRGFSIGTENERC